MRSVVSIVLATVYPMQHTSLLEVKGGGFGVRDKFARFAINQSNGCYIFGERTVRMKTCL